MLNPDMPAAELRLHMGELTEQEIRTARAAIRWANSEHARYRYKDFLEMRGVEKPCKRCQGFGVVAYPSTSTWMGGIGGMAITNGVCDKCWGSGDSNSPWVNLRSVVAQREHAVRLDEEVSRLAAQLEQVRSLVQDAVARAVENVPEVLNDVLTLPMETAALGYSATVSTGDYCGPVRVIVIKEVGNG